MAASAPGEGTGDSGEGAPSAALPPDKTWGAGHARRFRLLAQSEPKGVFFGVPSFDPPIDATRLFNGWAYVLGPFYYLGKGMWRKALVLALLVLAVAVVNGLVSAPRTALGGEVLLREALLEEYAGAGYTLMLLGFLFPLCVGLGKNLWAGLVACAFVAVFLWGEVRYPYLDMGPFSGFFWLNALPIWSGFAGAALFFLLARHFAAFLAFVALLLLAWGLGLPFSAVSCLEFPRVVIDLLCGMSATWDLYRIRVRHERFWW